MLKLYEFDALDGNEEAYIGVLGEAAQIAVTEEINSDYTLEFQFPQSGDFASEITVNRLIDCEGQYYRIVSAEKTASDGMIKVNCLHVFDADGRCIHLPSTGGDKCGVKPYEFLYDLLYSSDSPNRWIEIFTEEELEERRNSSLYHTIPSSALSPTISDYSALKWIGSDNSFTMDFFNMDKISPKSAAEQIIENCGIGELYKDNRKFAVVNKIGRTNAARTTLLSLDKNLTNLTVTRDIKDMVNRLYIYGKDDLTMSAAKINGVTYGLPYVESQESIAKYGCKMGYKDYSDYSDPNTLYRLGRWEFDKENPDRIDIPSITIEGTIIDLSKLAEYGKVERPGLGDAVRVKDNDGEIYEERIIKITYYPYEPEQTSVTIGRVKKDMFFYLNRIGRLASKYNRISTTNGKIAASQVL